ncbi:MAG: rhodanese-like domain-containing protein [Verrucomicrobiota bacterium]
MKNVLLLAITALALVGAQAYAGSGNCKDDGQKHSHGKDRGTKVKCSGDECRADTDKAKEMSKSKGEKQELATIGTAALKVLLDTSDDIVVLDARSDKYDDGKRLPGAVQLTADSSKEQIKDVVPNKDTLVIAYCSNPQCPASTHLAHHLQKHGYTNVIKYPDGIEAWIAAGNEVTEVAKD